MGNECHKTFSCLSHCPVDHTTRCKPIEKSQIANEGSGNILKLVFGITLIIILSMYRNNLGDVYDFQIYSVRERMLCIGTLRGDVSSEKIENFNIQGRDSRRCLIEKNEIK